MQDRELYWQILGIRERWRVERVELKVTEGQCGCIGCMISQHSGRVLNAASPVRFTIISTGR
jgi:hypothetical protein